MKSADLTGSRYSTGEISRSVSREQMLVTRGERHHMTIKLSYLLLGTAVSLALGAQGASAAKRQVGTCTTNPLQYPTIQSAVNAAQTNDKVQICPGSWPEEVVVAKAITLTNVPDMAFPTVAIPAGGAVQNGTTLHGKAVAAQILVVPTSPVQVNVKNLIVDGTGNNDMNCGLQLAGIYYQNAGGEITHDTAQNQLLPPDYQGCGDGVAILVENQTLNTPPVKISGNTVTNFDKNGIMVSYGAAAATITKNTVTGRGPTYPDSQIGIQLGYGASGSINGNTVSDFNYLPAPDAAGILLYDLVAGSYLSTPKVNGNTITNAQYGIVLYAVSGAPGALVPVKSNNISGAAAAGIGLYSAFGVDEEKQISNDYIKVNGNVIDTANPDDDIDACSDNNEIIGNTVINAAEGGIHLDGLCTQANGSSSGVKNKVGQNTITTNCVGILSAAEPGANNIRKNNSFNGNANNYIYGQDSYSCGTHPKRAKVTAMGLVRPLAR
jgi:hypothetical protein